MIRKTVGRINEFIRSIPEAWDDLTGIERGMLKVYAVEIAILAAIVVGLGAGIWSVGSWIWRWVKP